MGNEGVTQADHERPGMRPSQADDLVDEQPSKADAVATSIVCGCSLPRSQPMPIRRNRPDEPFGKEGGQRQSQSTGCSGALSHRKMFG
jgi:hypothetical protein